MKPLTNYNGTMVIEWILSIPILLGTLFFSIEISLFTCSKRLTQWACYQATRMSLPISIDLDVKSNHSDAIQEAKRILKKIPLQKLSPAVDILDTQNEVTVSISQDVSLLGRPYRIRETCSLYR